MRLRILLRFVLLALGFALTSFGLLSWQQVQFDLSQMWPIADELSAHPVYAIVVGLGLIPPTIWEIFMVSDGGQ